VYSALVAYTKLMHLLDGYKPNQVAPALATIQTLPATPAGR
jgi:hypothetical protein